jgi:hypothetical protein
MMPPVAFIDKAIGSLDSSTFTFQIPQRTKIGDQLAVMLCVGLTDEITMDANPDAFDVASCAVSASALLFIVRVWYVEEIGPTFTVEVDTGVPSFGHAVLIVLRGPSDAAIAELSATGISASTNFICPSRALAGYADLYMGIVLVETAETAITAPAGCTEIAEDQAGGRTLAAFICYAETAGATGTKTATVGANQSGGAASVSIPSSPPPVASMLKPDIAGAIGFTTVGV